MKKFLLFTILFLFFFNVYSQDKRSSKITQKDYFGFTAMGFYNYANWVDGKNKASWKFDSFRIWARTDLHNKFFASVQYRFYDGWRMPTNMFAGWNINDNNTLELGLTWVPFGFAFQPYDDWGKYNILCWFTR